LTPHPILNPLSLLAVKLPNPSVSGLCPALAYLKCVDQSGVVLADIEEGALAKAEEEIKATGTTVLAVLTDVSKAGDVEALAQKTLDAFGAVHLQFNNAGVCPPPTPVWENTLNDWKWVIGVNLWGVIHGVRAFVPIMLEQESECHIVNTASGAGLSLGGSLGPYGVTKHGVVTLSESLHLQLVKREAKVKVSVLCPSHVRTRVVDAARNRPDELQNAGAKDVAMPEGIRQRIAAGKPPELVADYVFDAIREGKFYILTHPERTKQQVRTRMEGILQERNPGTP